MEKINIENLFHCTTHDNTGKALDVKAITQSQKPFDTDILIETRERKRKILLNCYIKFYDKCLKKIEIANNVGKTDLLYSVSESIPNFPEYKPIDCIGYIRNKLENDSFDTYIVGNKTIFITWLYIEANREKIINSLNRDAADKYQKNIKRINIDEKERI